MAAQFSAPPPAGVHSQLSVAKHESLAKVALSGLERTYLTATDVAQPHFRVPLATNTIAMNHRSQV